MSTSNFIVGIHVCGKKVQNVAFLSHAAHCLDDDTHRFCSCHTSVSGQCCGDEAVVHKANELTSSTTSAYSAPPMLVAISQNSFAISEIIPTHQTLFSGRFNYDPPPESRDLTTIFLTFLI